MSETCGTCDKKHPILDASGNCIRCGLIHHYATIIMMSSRLKGDEVINLAVNLVDNMFIYTHQMYCQNPKLNRELLLANLEPIDELETEA